MAEIDFAWGHADGGIAALVVAGAVGEAVVVTAERLGAASSAACVEVGTGAGSPVVIGRVDEAEGVARARAAVAGLAVGKEGGAQTGLPLREGPRGFR